MDPAVLFPQDYYEMIEEYNLLKHLIRIIYSTYENLWKKKCDSWVEKTTEEESGVCTFIVYKQ